MNIREQEIFKLLMKAYKDQWDRNQYARTNNDSDLQAYVGYRNRALYPLAYNESFNKILPIIYTILSRQLSQLYQGGNIVSVKPRKKRDIGNAKSVEAVLNFQLENLNSIDMQGGSYLTMLKWLLNTSIFGKGVVKAYWRKEDRISPRRMMLQMPSFDSFGNFQGYEQIDHISQEMQTLYDAPYIENIHNKLFVPHPEYKSIQQMPFVFCVYKKPIDYIKKGVESGKFKRRNFREMGWETSSQASNQSRDSDEAFVMGLEIEGGLTTADIEDDRKSKSVDIIEAYGKIILESAPYEVGAGMRIKGMEEEAIVHIGNYKTVLAVQKSPYGARPFFDTGCYLHPEMYWDIGLARLTRGIQEQYNNLANLRMQNAMMLVNQMLRVDPDADVDPEALVWKPFGVVPALKDEVEPLTIPDFNSNVFMEQQNFYEDTIQDLMGFYDYNMGQTPQRQERVGTVYSIQSMGEARAKLMLMSMDYQGFRPMLNYMMMLNTFHLPSGFEYRISDRDQHQFGQIFGDSIHPNFDYAARYSAMEPALGKHARSQQLVQLFGMLQQSPWLNHYQHIKLMYELMDVYESDSLLKTPDQFMQEMQQQQQQQMMMEQTKQRFETEGKLAVGGQKIQGSLAVGAQDIQGDLLLESLKQEAANQEST
jgi:hypothetical protein